MMLQRILFFTLLILLTCASSEDTVRVVTGLVTGNRQEVVLNVGEIVRLGGGTTTHLDESLSVPASCPGPYWVVGGV